MASYLLTCAYQRDKGGVHGRGDRISEHDPDLHGNMGPFGNDLSIIELIKSVANMRNLMLTCALIYLFIFSEKSTFKVLQN